MKKRGLLLILGFIIILIGITSASLTAPEDCRDDYGNPDNTKCKITDNQLTLQGQCGEWWLCKPGSPESVDDFSRDNIDFTNVQVTPVWDVSYNWEGCSSFLTGGGISMQASSPVRQDKLDDLARVLPTEATKYGIDENSGNQYGDMVTYTIPADYRREKPVCSCDGAPYTQYGTKCLYTCESLANYEKEKNNFAIVDPLFAKEINTADSDVYLATEPGHKEKANDNIAGVMKLIPPTNGIIVGGEPGEQCFTGFCLADKDGDGSLPNSDENGCSWLCYDISHPFDDSLPVCDCDDNLNDDPINCEERGKCAHQIYPGAQQYCNNLPNNCFAVDALPITRFNDRCPICCPEDECHIGSCSQSNVVCNTPPEVYGSSFGILWRNVGSTKFNLKKFISPADEPDTCKKGIIAGNHINNYQDAEKVSKVKISDTHTKFNELVFAFGDYNDNLEQGLAYKAVYKIPGHPEYSQPLQDKDLGITRQFIMKVEDTGVTLTDPQDSSFSDPMSKQVQVSALLCPKGEVDLGDLQSTAVWGKPEKETGATDDVQKTYSQKGGIKITFEPMSLKILQEEPPNFDLKINIHFEDVGIMMTDKAKEKMKESGVDVFIAIAKRLPWDGGTGDIEVSIKTKENPVCEDFGKLIISGKIGKKSINYNNDYDYSGTIKLINDVLDQVHNEKITCDGHPENRKITKEFNPKKEEVLCKVGSILGKSYKLKGWREDWPDGRFEYKDFNVAEVLGISWIAYDQGKHVISKPIGLVTKDKLAGLLKCAKSCESSKISHQSTIQSIYALRGNNLDYNGYAYQFLPSPLIFNKDVTRTFDKTLYTKENLSEVSIVSLNEEEAFDKCKYSPIDSITSEVYPNQNNTIEIGGLTYKIPEGAINDATDIIINLLYFYDCECNNGIQDSDEEGVDCGGSCSKKCSPNCEDGIQNQDEENIDCGGGHCIACDSEPYPDCEVDSDCTGFCQTNPTCLYGTCFCFPSCGDNKCEFSERFFDICEKDCPACESPGDIDDDCEISFLELLKFIRKWSKREVETNELINILNYWLN